MTRTLHALYERPALYHDACSESESKWYISGALEPGLRLHADEAAPGDRESPGLPNGTDSERQWDGDGERAGMGRVMVSHGVSLSSRGTG